MIKQFFQLTFLGRPCVQISTIVYTIFKMQATPRHENDSLCILIHSWYHLRATTCSAEEYAFRISSCRFHFINENKNIKDMEKKMMSHYVLIYIKLHIKLNSNRHKKPIKKRFLVKQARQCHIWNWYSCEVRLKFASLLLHSYLMAVR